MRTHLRQIKEQWKNSTHHESSFSFRTHYINPRLENKRILFTGRLTPAPKGRDPFAYDTLGTPPPVRIEEDFYLAFPLRDSKAHPNVDSPLEGAESGPFQRIRWFAVFGTTTMTERRIIRLGSRIAWHIGGTLRLLTY